MKYVSFGIVVLTMTIGLFIGSLIHIGNGSAILIGGFLGIILPCLFFDWRNRKRKTSSSSLLRHELHMAREAQKADAEYYFHEKFRR